MTQTTSTTDAPGFHALLAEPGAFGFFAAGFVGRIPLAMRALACVLLVQLITGSYGIAGLVGATQTLVGAIAAPRIGRIADRLGERTILIWGCVVQTIGITALVFSAHLGANPLLMCLSAALIGASNIPFSSLSRARWTRRLDSGPALERAYSLESMADEMGFVIGPLLAVPLCVEIDPAGGIIAALVFTIIAAVLLLRQSAAPSTGSLEVRLAPHAADDVPEHHSVIRIPGIRVIVGIMLAVGFLFGAVDIMVVAFAREHGATGATSILAALFAFGSFIGALAYGMRPWKLAIDRRLKYSIWWLVVGMIPVALANSIVFMGFAGVFIGLSISPALIAAATVIEHVTPRKSLTEAFAWLSSALATGAALGSGVCGFVLDHVSLRAGQSLGLVGAIGAGIAVAIWAPYLRPRPSEEPIDIAAEPNAA
jgi:MFS family permease